MHTPVVPPSSEISFRAHLHTRWSDEDKQGIVNNAVYHTLFEEARHAYFGELGVLDQNRFPFLLLLTNVHFKSPGTGGVDVTVELATTRLGTKSLHQAYRVLGPDATVWCEAQAVLVWCDVETNASAAMPLEMKRKVAASSAGASPQ